MVDIKRGVLKIKTPQGWVNLPSIGPQGETGPSFETYRRYGTSKPELWFASPHIASMGYLQGKPPDIGPGDFEANVLYAIPFMIDRRRIIDAIGVWAYNWTYNKSYKIRLGIYNDTDNMYPGSLLVETDPIELRGPNVDKYEKGNGIRFEVINQTLDTGIYWLAGVINKLDSSREDSGFLIGFSYGSISAGISPLGFPLHDRYALDPNSLENNFSFTCYWYKFTYANLPVTFKGGLSPSSENCPVIFARFSS